MRTFLFLFIFIPFIAEAGWSEKARTFLPSQVSKLKLGQTDREAARKTLGKPGLVKGDKEYWEMEGFKYALELTYKDNKLVSLHYNFPSKGPAIDVFKKEIDPKRLKTSPSSPHTSLVYEDKEGKLEVELATGNVQSVRFQ